MWWALPNERKSNIAGRSPGGGVVSEMRPALVKFFTRKTGSAVEAEDLAQDVLLRVLTHANWKSHDQAKGYIFRAAVNRRRSNTAHDSSTQPDSTRPVNGFYRAGSDHRKDGEAVGW